MTGQKNEHPQASLLFEAQADFLNDGETWAVKCCSCGRKSGKCATRLLAQLKLAAQPCQPK